jgi:homoserine acetyltransferase
VRILVDAARAAGIDATYREISSDKGHDAFLVEWDQLVAIIGEALEGLEEERVAASA